MTPTKMAAVHAPAATPSARCTLDKILETLATMGSRLSDMETKLSTVSSTVSSHDHDIQDLKTGLNMMGERVPILDTHDQQPNHHKLQAHLQAGTTGWRPPKQD